MDDELYNNIKRIIQLEHENAENASRMLQEAMNRGEKNIDMLDRIADRLLDSMNGFSGEGEDMYRTYLDYIETFNPTEARERKNDLEYDLGYKTHVLYAAAMLCQKEVEDFTAANGKPAFDVIMHEYIPKVYDITKKTASFLFFAYFAHHHSLVELMSMLKTITEETDYILDHIEEYDDLMHYPRETYHPLREDEWQLIQNIAEHNIDLYNAHPELNKDLLHNVFGS